MLIEQTARQSLFHLAGTHYQRERERLWKTNLISIHVPTRPNVRSSLSRRHSLSCSRSVQSGRLLRAKPLFHPISRQLASLSLVVRPGRPSLFHLITDSTHWPSSFRAAPLWAILATYTRPSLMILFAWFRFLFFSQRRRLQKLKFQTFLERNQSTWKSNRT